MNRQNLARSSTKHKSSAFSRLRQHATFRRFNEVGALHARYEQTIHSIDAAGNRNIGSTYSVYRCRHPPYRTDTADVVNDGAYGGGGVSSPLAGARPRIPCAPPSERESFLLEKIRRHAREFFRPREREIATSDRD